MKQYEYKTLELHSAIGYSSSILNEWGKKGWKLVGVSAPISQLGTWNYHMEREIEKSDEKHL